MNLLYPTEQDVSIFLLQNREKYSITQLCDILGFKSRTSIINRIKRLNLPRKSQRKGSLHKLLEETLETYYWIGFILADGHFTKSNQLVVVSSLKDQLHLEKLAKFLDGQVKIYDRSDSPGKYEGSEKQFCRIAIQDHKIGKQIKEKFDINNNKTYKPNDLRKLNIQNDLMKSLIIGFVDGDGSFLTENSIRIECHSAWRNNLFYIKEFCEKYLDAPDMSISDESREHCYITLNSKSTKELRQFALENKLPFMQRKWIN